MRTIEDVTRDLTALETRVSFALNAAEIGVWEWQIGTGNLIWNNQMLKLFNLDVNTYMNVDHLVTLVHPDDLPGVKAAFNHTAECGAPFDISFRIKYYESWRRIVQRGAVRCDSDGHNPSIVGVAYADNHYCSSAMDCQRRPVGARNFVS